METGLGKAAAVTPCPRLPGAAGTWGLCRRFSPDVLDNRRERCRQDRKRSRRLPGGPVREAWRDAKSGLRGASREMVESMSEKQLEDFAKGSRKGKPEHVKSD